MSEEKNVEKDEKTETVATATKGVATKNKPEMKLSKQAEEVVKTVESMTVLELSNLVKALEEKFGVSASMLAATAVVQGGSQASSGVQAQEEKSTFTVELASVGPNKIQVIKEIRAVTNLGLKEAKDLVDSAPKPIKADVNKEEAEEIKKKLTAVGATVELK